MRVLAMHPRLREFSTELRVHTVLTRAATNYHSTLGVLVVHVLRRPLCKVSCSRLFVEERCGQ